MDDKTITRIPQVLLGGQVSCALPVASLRRLRRQEEAGLDGGTLASQRHRWEVRGCQQARSESAHVVRVAR